MNTLVREVKALNSTFLTEHIKDKGCVHVCVSVYVCVHNYVYVCMYMYVCVCGNMHSQAKVLVA